MGYAFKNISVDFFLYLIVFFNSVCITRYAISIFDYGKTLEIIRLKKTIEDLQNNDDWK